MRRRIWFLVICLLFTICMFPLKLEAKSTSSLYHSNNKLMEQLHDQGYSWDDIEQAKEISKKIKLRIDTILRLKPLEIDWATVENGLLEMKKIGEVFEKNDFEGDYSVLKSLKEEGFNKKEAMLIAYYCKIFEGDIKQVVTWILADKEQNKSEIEQSFADIDLSTEEYSITAITATEIYDDPGYGYEPEKSAPLGSLASYNEQIMPSTGALILTETDLSLPGKNGLDFNLTRIYKSDRAELKQMACEVEELENGRLITSYTYGNNTFEKLYGIGVGWAYDIPKLEMSNQGPLYLHMNLGNTYKIDLTTPTGFADVETKEYILEEIEYDYYKLTHKTGIIYKFNLYGHLLSIENRYGDKITFLWGYDQTYQGNRLVKVTDSVNRVINFTYTDDLVTVTTGNFQIKYHREKIDDWHHKLTQVEYPEGIVKKYDYLLQNASFKFEFGIVRL